MAKIHGLLRIHYGKHALPGSFERRYEDYTQTPTQCLVWFNARRYLGYDITEWENLPWWQQDAYMSGMNQYFEWEVKLAGGKMGAKPSGGFGSSSASGDIGGPTDSDIGDLVPIQRV